MTIDRQWMAADFVRYVASVFGLSTICASAVSTAFNTSMHVDAKVTKLSHMTPCIPSHGSGYARGRHRQVWVSQGNVLGMACLVARTLVPELVQQEPTNGNATGG
jgi:hypothetical protein